MVKRSTTRTRAIALALVAILLVSIATWWLITESQSRNSLNITRAEYEAALAKWNSLQVTDYEAEVQQIGGGKQTRWKIVVNVDTKYGMSYVPGARASYSHRIKHFEGLDSESAKYSAESVEFETVGGLFDWVYNALYCQENSCSERDFFIPTRYVVEFDHTMGYPRSVTSINEYAIVEMRIENVIVLGRSGE